MNGNKPLISVLITAYNRREYLGQAVESALNQTLPRTEYEVVVTKNFDHECDREWASRGVKLVWFDGAAQGPQVADALPYCSGRYIAFLDDDWWAPHKLEHVASAWTRNPNLCFYKNGMIFVSYDSTSRNFHPIWYEKDLTKFNRAIPWHNSNSISIAKSLLAHYAHYLEKVEMGFDLFLYYAALSSGEPMM
jgi:glycosyltransferase involved in cell wall biosynthesis